MKLHITLSSIVIYLFINNVYAKSTEAIACNQSLEKGDLTVALSQANLALISNKNDKDVLVCQGRVLAAKGDFNAALTSFKSAEVQSADAFDKTIATLLIGNTYKALKQYDLSINSYQQTMLNAKTAKSQAFERLANNAIANVYVENMQLAQALESYMAGSKLAENDNERGESYEAIAFTYHNMNQHDLALEYQIKAYTMHAAVGTLDQLAHTSIELGRYHLLTKHYISAENALNKIIKFAKEQGGAYYEAKASVVLAKVRLATGDITAANALIKHAKSIAKDTHDKLLDEEINQETKNLY
jgi:tetratricopeptide (TPR) repeat protein